ncbi:MAG: UDP-N-acetylmuramate dehydrogenase [Spirochaetales bacterium]|nr:UDP-N-acetylmuramate dehydrogenase [Spirochaetales bacterium]
MHKLPNIQDKFNIRGILVAQEPMWRHTTFRLGGPADLYAQPLDAEDLAQLQKMAFQEGLDLFLLGGGANLLVSDQGIRGLVADTRNLNEWRREENLVILGGGLDVSEAAWRTSASGAKGLEFLFGMPGSVGGALWMNARCYNQEISDVFEWADVLNADGSVERIPMNPNNWAYKHSPFQEDSRCILRCGIRVEEAPFSELRQSMVEKRNDREEKGHYRAPCAGSAFKNNRDFGVPSGVLIDRCGLKGLRHGGASVSQWHGNIVINDQGATSSHVDSLLDEVARIVEEESGFCMEREVLRVGDWQSP